VLGEADRLGDRREQCGRQIPAGRRQELQTLIERQRVGAVGREQWSGFEELRGERRAAPVARPSAHLLPIPADGVDLPVVGDRAEGLSEAPDGRRVRGVPLVEDHVCEVEVLAQVRVEIGQARAGDEPLVDDRGARRRRDRHLRQRPAGGSHRQLEPSPGDHQPALEVPVRHASGARDDRLRDVRP
jgi:hypothetical protein